MLLSFKSSLYILNNSPLSGSCFVNVLSQSMIYLFKAEVLNFNEALFISFFLSWVVLLVLYLKTHFLAQDHLNFLLCYLLKGFIVLCFTFRSMIHFELIFMKGIRPVFIFFLFSCRCIVVPETYF